MKTRSSRREFDVFAEQLIRSAAGDRSARGARTRAMAALGLGAPAVAASATAKAATTAAAQKGAATGLASATAKVGGGFAAKWVGIAVIGGMATAGAVAMQPSVMHASATSSPPISSPHTSRWHPRPPRRFWCNARPRRRWSPRLRRCRSAARGAPTSRCHRLRTCANACRSSSRSRRRPCGHRRGQWSAGPLGARRLRASLSQESPARGGVGPAHRSPRGEWRPLRSEQVGGALLRALPEQHVRAPRSFGRQRFVAGVIDQGATVHCRSEVIANMKRYATRAIPAVSLLLVIGCTGQLDLGNLSDAGSHVGSDAGSTVTLCTTVPGEPCPSEDGGVEDDAEVHIHPALDAGAQADVERADDAGWTYDGGSPDDAGWFPEDGGGSPDDAGWFPEDGGAPWEAGGGISCASFWAVVHVLLAEQRSLVWRGLRGRRPVQLLRGQHAHHLGHHEPLLPDEYDRALHSVRVSDGVRLAGSPSTTTSTRRGRGRGRGPRL